MAPKPKVNVNPSNPNINNPTTPNPPTSQGPGDLVIVSVDGLLEAGKLIGLPGLSIRTALAKWKTELSSINDITAAGNDETGHQFTPLYLENKDSTADLLTTLSGAFLTFEGNFIKMANNSVSAEEHNSR